MVYKCGTVDYVYSMVPMQIMCAVVCVYVESMCIADLVVSLEWWLSAWKLILHISGNSFNTIMIPMHCPKIFNLKVLVL